MFFMRMIDPTTSSGLWSVDDGVIFGIKEISVGSLTKPVESIVIFETSRFNGGEEKVGFE